MKDFATLPNTTGAYPDVEPTDVSAPAAADGTPVMAQWVKELMGSFQAILNAAGLTPSGTSESDTVSQILLAIRRVAHYPGEIFAWGGAQTDIQATLGIRALPLSGQGIVRANYVDLDTAVYCGNTNNPVADAYFRSNTSVAPYSRSTSGTYLILPDARGRFLRALDPTGTIDIDGGASRLSGSPQNYALYNHRHHNLTGSGYLYTTDTVNLTAGASGYNMITKQAGGSALYVGSSSGDVSYSSNYENRPANMAVRYFIAY